MSKSLLRSTGPTVREWSIDWQRYYPGKRNAETRRHNAQMIAPFVRRHGSKRLDAVTVLLCQEWANRNPGHVRYLRLMFAKAVKAELLERNPWANVELPATEGKPRRPPTPEELERLLAAAKVVYPGVRGEHYADLLEVVAYSGLRLGGVAGLRIRDVLSPGRVYVIEKGERSRESAVFGPGREALARALRRRSEQIAGPGAIVLAPKLRERLLWISPGARPFDKHSLGRVYRRVCDEAGVTDSTIHSLRHFCATWLLDQGATDQDVAIQLGHLDEQGHANVEHVRGTYGHPTVEPALQRLERLVEAHEKEGSHDGGGSGPAGAAGAQGAPGGRPEGDRELRRHLRAVGADEPAGGERAGAAEPTSEAGGARA